MGLSPQLMTEDLYKKAKARLQTLTQNNRAAIRLRAIVSVKEQGVNVVARVFGVTGNTLRSWIKGFEKEGLEGLDYHPGRGRKSNLSKEHIEAIRQWVLKESHLTIAALLVKLEEVYGVKSSKSAVHRVLQHLNLAYITPRPVHHKQNKELHQGFKKKSSGSYPKQS